MLAALRQECDFSNIFLSYLLRRNLRYEEDLMDQLFNSSEKRLARILLLLSHFEEDREWESGTLRISQETLAHMVGTTRSRVNMFVNRFKKLGFIEYKGGPARAQVPRQDYSPRLIFRSLLRVQWYLDASPFAGYGKSIKGA